MTAPWDGQLWDEDGGWGPDDDEAADREAGRTEDEVWRTLD